MAVIRHLKQPDEIILIILIYRPKTSMAVHAIKINSLKNIEAQNKIALEQQKTSQKIEEQNSEILKRIELQNIENQRILKGS